MDGAEHGRNGVHDKQSEIPGIDTSEITCIKSEKVCHEVQANLVNLGDGTFTLTGDSEDYPVVRWNNDEIFARTIGGICRAANVIKFDLRTKTKKVYSLQTLTEPNRRPVGKCLTVQN
jgi:cellobiose phosphorylase